MASDTSKTKGGNEKIINDFQVLRNEQRGLVNNLNTFEMDLKEHNTVIDTLKTVNSDRKCYRLIGGVLCERTVEDVLPELIDTSTQLKKRIETVNEQLVEKGKEINKFRDEHNIKIRGQDTITPENKTSGNDEAAGNATTEANRNHILVTN